MGCRGRYPVPGMDVFWHPAARVGLLGHFLLRHPFFSFLVVSCAPGFGMPVVGSGGKMTPVTSGVGASVAAVGKTCGCLERLLA